MDDLHKRRPQDASKISLTEDWEVRYWCGHFGCAEAKLRAAVAAVGHGAHVVGQYLATH